MAAARVSATLERKKSARGYHATCHSCRSGNHVTVACICSHHRSRSMDSAPGNPASVLPAFRHPRPSFSGSGGESAFADSPIKVVGPAGLEPATTDLEGRFTVSFSFCKLLIPLSIASPLSIPASVLPAFRDSRPIAADPSPPAFSPDQPWCNPWSSLPAYVPTMPAAGPCSELHRSPTPPRAGSGASRCRGCRP